MARTRRSSRRRQLAIRSTQTATQNNHTSQETTPQQVTVMCEQYPYTCALRDNHHGPHITAPDLETTINNLTSRLDTELTELRKAQH